MPSPMEETPETGERALVEKADVNNIILDTQTKLPSENGNIKTARITAKRKPDKSKIFRIRTNDLEESQMNCSFCLHEFNSKEELEKHQETCSLEHQHTESLSDRDHHHPDDVRRHQDEANNNQATIRKSQTHNSSQNSRESSLERSISYDSDSGNQGENTLVQISNYLQQTKSQLPLAQQLAHSNLVLENIQSTRMALAQLASNALGNGQPTSPQAMQEMALLQSTLYTLQHQQMMQLQLIQQLQSQLSIKNKENEGQSPASNGPEESKENKEELKEASSVAPLANENHISSTGTSSFIHTLMERFQPNKNGVENENNMPTLSPNKPTLNDCRDRPLSPPMTASNIASSVIQHTDPPPTDEPNTLEMLQRTANEVLNNASQGLLTNRLIDDYNKPPDGKDAYYKHRCRYCGKVFGSDSALQIHVRSHTGERPFKCNICGNRFTTKGNLKVHFQRHSVRFPHIKMNPHPVPEHLDKLHPPLLARMGELKDYPSPPTGPPNPFETSPIGPSLPPFRLSAPIPPGLDLNKPFNASEFIRKEMPTLEMEEPENLSGTRNSYESDEDERHDTEMTMDERISHNEEPKEKEPFEKLLNIHAQREKEKYISNEESNYIRTPSFHETLQEVLSNNLREHTSDKIKESLKISLQNHLKDTMKELTRENFEESVETSENQEKTISQPLNSIFREPVIDSSSESSKDKEEIPLQIENTTDGVNTVLETEMDSSPPLDIRIKADQELKDSLENDKINREDMDTDNSDSQSATSDQPTDLRVRPDFSHFPFPNIQLPGSRLPFPFVPGMSPPFLPSSAPPTPCVMMSNIDPSKDPNIYANLLPRPGSTDNSWEALIEVEKASETMKLENLVNNIEHKLSDPNQCIICHRVLSCKSALQMHYRTHTGERPFKCKICGRAFTTKGNLKTHMGVHRAKPPMRMLHQCPVCHKKFTNALVLQQHIRLHTGEPTDLTPEQISAAEVRDYHPSISMQGNFPPMLPVGFPHPSPPFHGFPPIPLHLRYQLSPDLLRRLEMEADERKDEEERYLRLINNSPRSSSASSAEQRMAEDLSVRMRNEENLNGGSSPHHSVSPTPSDYSDIDERLNESHNESHIRLMERLMNPSISQAMATGIQESISAVSSAPLDLASRPPPPLFSHFGLLPPHLTSSNANQGAQSLPNMNIFMANIPGRGNTTCSICFKTFACQSALEIHYRSHTKERPFKCNVCDRGFSTKQGNMKQHMLTHKMRDECSEEGCAKKGSNSQNSSSSSKNEENADIPIKRDNSGIKREREGDIILPVSKRSAGENPVEVEENNSYNDEPPVLSPEAPIPRSYSPREVSPTLSRSPVHPNFSISNSLHRPTSLPIQTSLPLPPTLNLPSSFTFPSSLPLSILPPTSIGLTPTQPLPHS